MYREPIVINGCLAVRCRNGRMESFEMSLNLDQKSLFENIELYSFDLKLKIEWIQYLAIRLVTSIFKIIFGCGATEFSYCLTHFHVYEKKVNSFQLSCMLI
jgi:hypothetical protein